MGMPRTSSITKYGRPVIRRPGVKHFGDVGMVHHRQRLRSASKRATTDRVSIPNLMIFSATRRRTGVFCSAT